MTAHPIPNETLDLLIRCTQDTNIKVLNTILWHADKSYCESYTRALDKLIYVRDKMEQAAAELFLCL